MKRRLTPLLTALAIGALVAPATARAQSNTFHFNVAAGAALPTGNFSNGTDVGYNITGGIAMMQRGSPLGFRVEGMFNEFGVSNTDTKLRVAAGTANATYDLPMSSVGAGNALYLIGGIGYYNTKDTFFDSSESNVGFNVGAGFRFPLTGFSAYVEARYHTVSAANFDAHFIPIVFGLSF